MAQIEEWDAPAIAAIKAAIDPLGGFTPDDMTETGRLLTACCMAAESSTAEYNYVDEIRVILEGLTNGYGCWLEHIEQAIDSAEIPEEERAAIRAAFGMASAWLLDIFRRQQGAHIN